MNKLSDFITPSHTVKARGNNFKHTDLNIEEIKSDISEQLMAKFKITLAKNLKAHDLYYGLIEKPSGSEYDISLAFVLKREGYSYQEVANILYHYTHGSISKKADGAEKWRQIERCYNRCDSHILKAEEEFESLPQKYIDQINAQINPILTARKADTALEKDLDQSARFRAVKLSDMDWRYSGLPIYKDFIYEKAITVIYGKSNTGKSFSATDIAGHIALGLDWNSMKFKPKEEISVLYICAEAGKSYGKRGKALRIKLSIDDLPYFVIDEAPHFTDKDKTDAKSIVEEIKRLESGHGIKIGLVVVDTLAITFEGGNENSPEDMGTYISNMKYIQRYADTGVLIVHHSGKDQAAGARGHSSLQAATDTEMEVTEKDHYRQIKVKKQREGQKGQTIKFNLQPVTLGIDDDGEPIDSCYVISENDAEFEFPSSNPEDELKGTKKAASVTLKRFQEPDFLKWCEGKGATEIRKFIVKHWYLTKDKPEKILSLDELENAQPKYKYGNESRNFARDFDHIKLYFDNTEFTLDQWIKEYLVKSAQVLSS